ncbi:Ataxin-3-like isoform X1 [Oopsacas minuta]|uniref:ubiquitinyl hydrolase 1 n=1 Tax=Oopsacas minuta TaxID=111878 RepID=A0AAV7JV95_9METZ|nr:Ataxin-3-like isoform X1 [Oopsacas minuta]
MTQSVISEFIESICHYKQEDDNMCAQHCLNALIQQPHFHAALLAEIATELDLQERETYLVGGADSLDYLKAMQGASNNMDDSGCFSIQVITKALNSFNLNIMPISSKDAGTALSESVKESAFICNFQSHWFTIRRFSEQWVDLNSQLKRPNLISDTYLSIYLTQLVQEGYSIFVVKGELPYCIADQLSAAYELKSISDNGGDVINEIDKDEMRQIEEAIFNSIQAGGGQNAN